MPRAEAAHSDWNDSEQHMSETQQRGLAAVPSAPHEPEMRPVRRMGKIRYEPVEETTPAPRERALPETRRAREDREARAARDLRTTTRTSDEPRARTAQESAERRRDRVSADNPDACLSRADASGFADAFDIDDNFVSPSRGRFARGAESGSVIVLHRGGTEEFDQYEEPEGQQVLEDEYLDTTGSGAQTYVDGEVELIDDLPARDPRTGRRTVSISGNPQQGATPRRLRELDAPRRPRKTVSERAAATPDRVALYAVLLGLFLVVIAAASGGAHA